MKLLGFLPTFALEFAIATRAPNQNLVRTVRLGLDTDGNCGFDSSDLSRSKTSFFEQGFVESIQIVHESHEEFSWIGLCKKLQNSGCGQRISQKYKHDKPSLFRNTIGGADSLKLCDALVEMADTKQLKRSFKFESLNINSTLKDHKGFSSIYYQIVETGKGEWILVESCAINNNYAWNGFVTRNNRRRLLRSIQIEALRIHAEHGFINLDSSKCNSNQEESTQTEVMNRAQKFNKPTSEIIESSKTQHRKTQKKINQDADKLIKSMKAHSITRGNITSALKEMKQPCSDFVSEGYLLPNTDLNVNNFAEKLTKFNMIHDYSYLAKKVFNLAGLTITDENKQTLTDQINETVSDLVEMFKSDIENPVVTLNIGNLKQCSEANGLCDYVFAVLSVAIDPIEGITLEIAGISFADLPNQNSLVDELYLTSKVLARAQVFYEHKFNVNSKQDQDCNQYDYIRGGNIGTNNGYSNNQLTGSSQHYKDNIGTYNNAGSINNNNNKQNNQRQLLLGKIGQTNTMQDNYQVNTRNRRDLVTHTEFRKIFSHGVQTILDSAARKLKLLNFQRSMCLIDLYESTKKSQSYSNMYTGVHNDKIKDLIARNIVGLFEAQDRNNCGKGCGTQFLAKHYQVFLDDIERIHDEIVNKVAKTGEKKLEKFEISHHHGFTEAGYINYRVVFQMNGNAKGSGCSYAEILLKKCNSPSIKDEDTQVNLGIFIHFSEFKFNYKKNDQTTIKRLTEDAIGNYFRYNMIISAIDKTNLDLKMPKFTDDFKYKEFVSKVQGSSKCQHTTKFAGNECVAPVCLEVMDTLEKCTGQSKSKHYIIILDGSGSVSSSDYQNSLKTIESMSWFGFNGKNKVTIFQFASGITKLCNAITDFSQIERCLRSKSQTGGGTNTILAFQHALQYMIDRTNYDYVVAMFTDGGSSSGLNNELKKAADDVRHRGTILPFGIGPGFNKAELEYFGGSQVPIEVKDYEGFEKNRYVYQIKMCGV